MRINSTAEINWNICLNNREGWKQNKTLLRKEVLKKMIAIYYCQVFTEFAVPVAIVFRKDTP